MYLNIHNVHQKSSAIFMIDPDSIDPSMKISKLKGKIYPQSTEKLVVSFSSNEARKFTGISIIVHIRGGNPIKVPVSAEVIIPKITIYEKEFNFGKITYGNSSTLELNIENTSPILAKLKLDLRSKEEFKESGIECLKIKQVRESDEESFIMEGIENEYLKILEKKQKTQKLAGMDLQSTSGDSEQNESDLEDGFDAGRSFTGSMQSMENDSLNLDEDMDAINYYIITLKPHKIYKFELTFTPQNTKKYEFNLPLRMGNSLDFNPELQKLVSVESVPPKIILEPIDGVRDFKKKIITHTD